MSRLAYYPTPANRRLGIFPLDTAKRWSGSAGVWGVGVGTALLFLLSVTPKVKNTFLLKVPVVSSYFEDKTPASDKPF
ncbi:ubiquinol-cytochrome-c reductase complex subunit-domain-containing protein [Lactarius quietus]|nr:ubiquinol-cytochrome-c reductase complex subunit-domain-containing protein [Lactarius quietus]